MSLRNLYRIISVLERTCSFYGCQKPILRNIARGKDGRLYHWGCLQTALDKRFQCLECNTSFDGTQVGFSEAQSFRNDTFTERARPACPSCGSINLKRSWA